MDNGVEITCHHCENVLFSNFAVTLANIAVRFRKLQSYFESYSHISKVTVTFRKLGPVLRKWHHISKVTFRFTKLAVTFQKLQSVSRNLQSHFEGCSQIGKSCGHNGTFENISLYSDAI